MEIKQIQSGIYRHYKGNIYQVICTVKHTETLEDMVVYSDIVDDEKKWARPLAMWNETVTVDGVTKPRFELIATSVEDMDSKALFPLINKIADIMEQDDRNSEFRVSAFYNKNTGEIIEIRRSSLCAYEDGEPIIEPFPNDEKNIEKLYAKPDSYIALPDSESIDEYDIMQSFAYGVPIIFRDNLLNALEGKGAFHRFKDVCRRNNLLDDWYSYKTAAYRKEAREWCDFKGIKWSTWLVSVQMKQQDGKADINRK